MDDPTKMVVQLAVDRDLVAAADAAGFDLADLTEAALRRRLGNAHAGRGSIAARRVASWRREHAEAIALQNEAIDREGLFGEEWRTF